MENEKKNYENMISIDDIRHKVENYIKETFGEEKCILEPIFREEDGKYYLCFAVIDFVDEKNSNYNVKRPTKWILVDIVTGDLFKIYNSNSYDYTDSKTLPFDKEFINNGNSALYDSSNYVFSSYSKWKNQIIEELNKKYKKDSFNIMDPKILRLDNETISPNTFVLANIDSILEEIEDKIIMDIGDKIQEMYKDYFIYIIDLIRKHYIISGEINKVLLSSYIDLIKYSWPSFIDIINAIDNIDHPNDLILENALRNSIKNENYEFTIKGRIGDSTMSITYKYENGKGNYICDEEIKMLFEDALKSNETIGPVGQYTERNINNPLSVLFILKDEIFDEVNEVKGNTPIAVVLNDNQI